jgi:hypothetical protein
MKPLHQERAIKKQPPGRGAPPKPGNPREEWVKAAIDGYVLRRFMRGPDVGESYWWESPPTTLEIAQQAARTCSPDVLIYAFRVEPALNEKHLALITRPELLGESNV